MNYAFQVSQSSYRTAESAFKKRWMYRPKSNQIKSRSQPKRVTPNLHQEEQWEPLCGWNCPEETNIDLIDIEGWIKKSQNARKDTEQSLVENFLHSVLVTCPSIYDSDEFREASLTATASASHHDVVDVGPGVDETTQAELESASILNQKKKLKKSEKIDIESLQSASTVSSKSCSSGEHQNAEKRTQVEETEGDAVVGGHRSEEAKDERTDRVEDHMKETEEESQISKTHSNLKSKSATSVRQLDKPKTERRILSAQSDPKGASGDGIKQSSLRKNSSKKSVAKKVTLNPAPIEISYTEGGLFEVTSPTRIDEDLLSQENQENRFEKDESETSHRISLKTPDRKAWEQSLRHQVSFELPVLSSLSVGDLLSSTPRLEQFVENTDSKLTFIQALYDKTSVQPDSVSVDNSVHESYFPDQNSFSNLPSLNRNGSPHSLVSSPGTERKSKPVSATGQDDASQVMAPSVTNSNRQSLSSNRDSIGSHLQGGRKGSKGDTSDSKLTQQRGPPGFRPPSNKTPLQRAMENAHKKIYGEHHYLLSQQNISNGQVEPPPSSKDARLRQTKSARTTPKVNNAYMWKERLDQGIKQQRSMSAKLVARLSSSSANQTIDPSVQILSKVESRNAQLQKSYSELFRLARQKKLQLRKGGDKFYTLSDFQAPLEKTNVLRTQRGKVSQR